MSDVTWWEEDADDFCYEVVRCPDCTSTLGVADARVWRLEHHEDGSHSAVSVPYIDVDDATGRQIAAVLGVDPYRITSGSMKLEPLNGGAYFVHWEGAALLDAEAARILFAPPSPMCEHWECALLGDACSWHADRTIGASDD